MPTGTKEKNMINTSPITTDDLEQALHRMIRNWPSEFIARTEIERFTGGMISYKTQANIDAAGKGPGRVKRGGKTGYIKEPYVRWFRRQMVIRGK
jgi:hypothetical protein